MEISIKGSVLIKLFLFSDTTVMILYGTNTDVAPVNHTNIPLFTVFNPNMEQGQRGSINGILLQLSINSPNM